MPPPTNALRPFIRDKNIRNPYWRRSLLCASFKFVPFYVDQQGQSSGRRTVTHEYPKRDVPYAEDMGRAAYRYQMTGYLIQAPGHYDTPTATRPNGMTLDYSFNRDKLRSVLDSIGPGPLQDPYNPNLSHLYGNGLRLLFQCERYTCTESRERGGYCVFEMSFVESGFAAGQMAPQNTASNLQQQSTSVLDAASDFVDASLNSMKASEMAGAGGITFPE